MLLPKNKTISLTYNDSDFQEVNGILEKMQTKFGLNSDSMKGLFLEILRKGIMDAEIIESSDKGSSELSQTIEQLEKDKEELQIKLETASNQKELVPIPLTEGQCIVTMDDQQSELMDKIAENRLRQYQAKGIKADKETPSELFTKSFFNKGHLENWGGSFYTGL